jgi:hypothetical protein
MLVRVRHDFVGQENYQDGIRRAAWNTLADARAAASQKTVRVLKFPR